MAKRMEKLQRQQVIEPEERVIQKLPAACHIWETPSKIFCNIWWGQEQEAGKRLIEISQLFPGPDPIPRGGGIFEEILYFLSNFKDVEIYIVGYKPEEGKEYSNYKRALNRIKEFSISATIVSLAYERRPFSRRAHTCFIEFLKKDKPAQ